MSKTGYLVMLLAISFMLAGCGETGRIVTDDDTVADDDSMDDDATDDDDDATGDDDDDVVTGEFTAGLAIIDIHMEPSPVPEEPPHLVAAFGFTYTNTYESILIDSVIPGPVTILRAADDTEVVSLFVEPAEPWDHVVPADSTLTLDYEATGLAGPPPGPQDLPCNTEVYAEVGVNYGSGEAVSAVSPAVIFVCGPEPA